MMAHAISLVNCICMDVLRMPLEARETHCKPIYKPYKRSMFYPIELIVPYIEYWTCHVLDAFIAKTPIRTSFGCYFVPIISSSFHTSRFMINGR